MLFNDQQFLCPDTEFRDEIQEVAPQEESLYLSVIISCLLTYYIQLIQPEKNQTESECDNTLNEIEQGN